MTKRRSLKNIVKIVIIFMLSIVVLSLLNDSWASNSHNPVVRTTKGKENNPDIALFTNTSWDADFLFSNLSLTLTARDMRDFLAFLPRALDWVRRLQVVEVKPECQQSETISRQVLSVAESVSKIVKKSRDLKKLAGAIKEEMIRSGFGLEPYVTEQGDPAWIENGVVYRPFRPSPSKHGEAPIPHSADFEAYVPYNHTLFFQGRDHPKVNDTDRKIILWWQRTRYMPRLRYLHPLRACPDLPCLMTTWRTYAPKSSALVFAGELIRGPTPKREHDQVFIFNNHEPPVDRWINDTHIRRADFKWKNAFNWTMTYRMDSDIVDLYGIVRRRRFPKRQDYATIMKSKTKLAAWIVSNCGSPGGRDAYVEELQKYIPVDVYGDCGTLKCSRSEDGKCFEMVNTTYKFYLAFENSISTDYISEKFFRYLSANTIVVARASNDFVEHAPSEIFLNTADFPSPRKLAERILYLDRHDDEYVDMLKEKDKYAVIFEDYPIRDKKGNIVYMHYHYEAVSFCEICQRLWNLDSYRNVIPDIVQWLDSEPVREPLDIVF